MKRNITGAGLIVGIAVITLIFTCPLIAQETNQSASGQQVRKPSTTAVPSGQT